MVCWLEASLPVRGADYAMEWIPGVAFMKSRDITLLTKLRLVKAMSFPVVMYGYES